MEKGKRRKEGEERHEDTTLVQTEKRKRKKM